MGLAEGVAALGESASWNASCTGSGEMSGGGEGVSEVACAVWIGEGWNTVVLRGDAICGSPLRALASRLGQGEGVRESAFLKK